jgi:formate dehydrogenase subunit gamma
VAVLKHVGRHLGALLIGLSVALAAVAQTEPAASPPMASAWNSPPASWDHASEIPQYASVPGRETNRLIQGAGREWRELRNGPVTRYGGWLLAIVPAAIMLFHLFKGPIRLRGRPTGRLIERFNRVERVAHWTMAASFVLLAVTGIVILFGKHVILPWLGYTGFSWLVMASKSAHNFVGPLFIFSLAISFLLFVKDNLVKAIDLNGWCASAACSGKARFPPAASTAVRKPGSGAASSCSASS